MRMQLVEKWTVMKKKPTTEMIEPTPERMTRQVQCRLYQKDYDMLLKLEKAGLPISTVIRKCVGKALPEVADELIAEIRQSLTRP